MKYFCGLDVSLKPTAICIVNQDGEILREGQAPSEPRAIHEWLSKDGLVMERVGLEAGSLSPWLCHELLSLGYPAICIEARHAAAAMKAQRIKTDRNDARGIAHIMRTGWYREVHMRATAARSSEFCSTTAAAYWKNGWILTRKFEERSRSLGLRPARSHTEPTRSASAS